MTAFRPQQKGRLARKTVLVAVAALVIVAMGACNGGSEQSAQVDRDPAGSSSEDSLPKAASTDGRERTKQSAGTAGAETFHCSPDEAARPDRARHEVAGVIPPAVPRRPCTLPHDGCATVEGGGDQALPPAPGIRVAAVSRSTVNLLYDLGSDLEGCEPSGMTVGVITTVSGLPFLGDEYPVDGETGSLDVRIQHVPGIPEYGPPDILLASSYTAEGLRSESSSVYLPPPRGERSLSQREIKRIEAHKEACHPDVNDRTTCHMGSLHPVAGPVRVSAKALADSVRYALGAVSGSFRLTALNCSGGSRCDASFRNGRYRLGMTYVIRALRSVRTCWEVTGFAVTRPVPQLEYTAAPLPHQGCVST